MMIDSIESGLRDLRLEVSLAWGRTWRVRSKFGSSVAKKTANKFLGDNQERLLFVTGSGRSGTQLISDLLNKSGVSSVFHEPNFKEDVGTMDQLRRNQNLAELYWREFRGLEVYRRWISNPQAHAYGEVNGTIRYQVPAIKHLYPKAKLFLMVRDGRGVVRSVMGMPQFYRPGSKGAFALSPLQNDPIIEEWDGMSRFEKMCWSWRESNEFLMEYIPASHWLQLERVTTDYDYFTRHLSNNIDMQIPYKIWEATVSNRSRNASAAYKYPSWEDWSCDQKRVYVRICGETMAKFGYEI